MATGSRNKDYDIIIVGAGAAGLCAGMYASRRALKTLILSKDLGGQAALTNEIENYPGRTLLAGFDLMNDFKTQAEQFGAVTEMKEVTGIQKLGEEFEITTPHDRYTCKALILAFGLTPRDLGVPGEQALKGRGVSSCATCDGPLFKGKKVVVVGGGNAGLDATEYLSRIAASVTLVVRKDALTGPQALIDQLSHNPMVAIKTKTWPKELKGKNHLEQMILTHTDDGSEETIDADGCFVEIGHVAKTDFIQHLVELDERRQIKIDVDCKTSTPGVFAAGDITTISYKQVVISAGEGAKAALSAYQYLQQKGCVRGAIIDWGVAKKKS